MIDAAVPLPEPERQQQRNIVAPDQAAQPAAPTATGSATTGSERGAPNLKPAPRHRSCEKAGLADLAAKIVSPQNASSPANFDNLRALETACRALAVMRTEDYLGEWYIEDLAALVGVHPRTLLRACQTVLRMGPVRYLRYRQLNVIRRQLCWGDTSNSVTDVMQSVGISDMGRTAGEYKALFGETPSQTIRRTRQKRIPRSG